MKGETLMKKTSFLVSAAAIMLIGISLILPVSNASAETFPFSALQAAGEAAIMQTTRQAASVSLKFVFVPASTSMEFSSSMKTR